MAKTLPGDFKVTTSENPLLSKQAVTNKTISVPYINLQLNSYPNTNWTCSVVTISHFQCTTLNTWLTNLQSCDLQLCFMLALFHDKKCCNCFNLFSCILWDFIVLGLVLSWWRLKLNWRSVYFATSSREVRENDSREKGMWGAHDWKLKGHVRLLFSRVSHR